MVLNEPQAASIAGSCGRRKASWMVNSESHFQLSGPPLTGPRVGFQESI
jgi:hypothetical protein